ncbi:MAG TPA: rhomboid family intramembrane serine protease [Verrucomicrobiae bacterium]
MDPTLTRIPARSRRQAMDWSLVLASQQIETTIEYAPDASGWGLMVLPPDAERAVEAIRLYRLENRRWGWRRQVLTAGLLFDWTSLLWVLLIGIFFWLAELDPNLRTSGAMNAAKVAQGQWWRLFTAIWLHADAAHLAGNAALGLVLLGLAMGRYGTGLGLLASYVAGLGGNLAVWLLAPQQSSLGASGAVMGSLGLLAAQSFSLRRRTPQHARTFITGVLGGLMLFVLYGLNPETDVRAHLGGFVTGLLLGAALSVSPATTQRPRLNLLAAFFFLVLVILPWWEALRHLAQSIH